MQVTIVALGPTAEHYLRLAEGLGGRRAFSDELWGVNAMGDVLRCDRVFHMDDVRVQELRAEAGNDKIGRMLAWMKTATTPIYTSVAHQDYPSMIAYPLAEVIEKMGACYFNSTPAYAIAYAIYLGVTRINLFGLDYTWPDVNSAEAGKACCEYWLGRAQERGIDVVISDKSTLMDSHRPRTLYGYDLTDVSFTLGEGGKINVELTPKAVWPTAAEIEQRYSKAADN